MKSKASASMVEALAMLRKHGRLRRWAGGFWTFPGAKAVGKFGAGSLGGPFRVPEWHVGTSTVRALIERDLVVVVDMDRTKTMPLEIKWAEPA